MNTIIIAGLMLSVCLALAVATPVGLQPVEAATVEIIPVDAPEEQAGEVLGAEESRWGHHGHHGWGHHHGHHGWGHHHGHHGWGHHGWGHGRGHGWYGRK